MTVPLPSWVESMLDAADEACARGEHDFDNSFTHPPKCPNCGYDPSEEAE